MPPETVNNPERWRRFEKAGEVVLFLLHTWKALLLLAILIWLFFDQKLWRDSVTIFTSILLLFICLLPILDYFGFSFVPYLRKLTNLGEKKINR